LEDGDKGMGKGWSKYEGNLGNLIKGGISRELEEKVGIEDD
jgi:hypothetical protein